MVPEIDAEIDPVFIDGDDVFSKDELTDQDKEFIKTLLDKSNYNLSSDNDDDDDVNEEIIMPDIRPPIETGDQTTDDKNWNDYVKTLETFRHDLLVDEPDNNNNVTEQQQNDKQNLIRGDLFHKDIEGGDDIILPEAAITS